MSGIKERLKKIVWLRKIVRAVKGFLYPVKRLVCKYIAYQYIKKNQRITNEKIKVGFIAQIAWSWDKLEPVYEVLKNNKNFNIYLFVVPEENFKTYEIIPDYKENYFCKKYPECIKLLDDNGECIDIAEYHLDYLFYQRPFDYRIPKPVRSSRMVRYTKCCYLPYGFTASDAFNYNNLKNDFFDNQYMLFMDSAYMQGLFQKKYPVSHSKGIKKIEYLGYPALEKYINWGKNERSDGYITWTPRWSFDDRQGGSSFLKYKDNFLKFVSNNKGKYIFRPHPLIHAEIIGQKIMSEEEWQKYIDMLSENDVIIDMESAIDDILRKTEILITDFSTIIGNFLMMGRPIIYCDNGIKFNPVYDEIQKYLYTAYDWNHIEKLCEDIYAGKDDMRNLRKRFVEEKYVPLMGAGKRIADRIICDAKERGWRQRNDENSFVN